MGRRQRENMSAGGETGGSLEGGGIHKKKKESSQLLPIKEVLEKAVVLMPGGFRRLIKRKRGAPMKTFVGGKARKDRAGAFLSRKEQEKKEKRLGGPLERKLTLSAQKKGGHPRSGGGQKELMETFSKRGIWRLSTRENVSASPGLKKGELGGRRSLRKGLQGRKKGAWSS